MLTYVHLHSIKYFLSVQDKYINIRDGLSLRLTTDQRVKAIPWFSSNEKFIQYFDHVFPFS